MEQGKFGIAVAVDAPIDEAEARVRETLAAEGFGILTEIDVAATLKTKLGIERAPYKILGACNPSLAHQAIEAVTDIGVLLPCNVVLYAEGDHTVVEAMDPLIMSTLIENPVLAGVAEEARTRLDRALGSLI